MKKLWNSAFSRYAAAFLLITLFSVQLNAQVTNTYISPGPLGGYWNDPANWSEGHVPLSSENVLIPTDNDVVIYNVSPSINNITIEGSVKVLNAKDLSIAGDFIINGDGILVHDGSTIYLSGDFENNGTFASNPNPVEFTGSSSSVISGISGIVFSSLIINKTGGNVSLQKAIGIGSSLTFSGGNIITNSYAVDFLDNATVSGAGANGFVIGTVTKTGDDNFTFPVGASQSGSDYYAPVTVDNTSGATSDKFSATYFKQAAPGYSAFDPVNHAAMKKLSGNEYWEVNRENGSSTPQISLHWTDGEESGIDNPANLFVAHWNGSLSGTDKWENLANTATSGNGGAGNSGYVTSGSVSSFSIFTFASDNTTDENTFPIQLLSFSAECSQGSAEVHWTTGTELNNDYFELQASTDGEHYRTIHTQPGSGNSNDVIDYSATVKVNADVRYIRLKQVDYNGKSETFDPVFLSCNADSNNSLLVYPNPVQDVLNLEFSGHADEKVVVKIYSITGTCVYSTEQHLNGAVLSLPVHEELPAGVYMLSVRWGQQQLIRKLTK